MTTGQTDDEGPASKSEPISSEERKARIGAFFGGVMLCALVAAIFHLFDQSTITVHFLVDDASGINVGDPVHFLGTPVGTVDATEPLDAKRVAISVSLQRSKIEHKTEHKLLLFQDARITLSKSEKPDQKNIGLEPGDLKGYPLLDGQAIVAYKGSGGVPKSGARKGVLGKAGAYVKGLFD